MNKKMRIVIGADHAGFELQEKLIPLVGLLKVEALENRTAVGSTGGPLKSEAP